MPMWSIWVNALDFDWGMWRGDMDGRWVGGGGGREREELEVEGGEKGGFNFGIKVWKPRNLYRTFKLNECA